MESVRINSGAARVSTIGDAATLGICGSGLVDLLAELRTHGLMNELGVPVRQRQGSSPSPRSRV